MIATSLYRFVVGLSDRGWPEVKLHYLRTYDKKEIDYILFLDKKPTLAVESKIRAKNIPPQLKQLRYNYSVDFPLIQVVNQPGVLLKNIAIYTENGNKPMMPSALKSIFKPKN